ncbi:hypothetical protein [Priestia megaterium]|uniref:hypothetical protein n=1 Tax=Priestia megaterium TaxID=1404 RepID=UPI0021F46356|nr:hypothetical protein [Priestia megaterium]UYP07333.1 hypothetical protein OIJ04_24890 [Priestia megaterium]
MSVLDARVINTKQGLEIYSDLVETSEITKVHIPTLNTPFFEIQFGIGYFLLRKEKYYDRQKNYFKLRMSPDFESIILQETETESLFAVKSTEEREATKKLLAEWFIKTNVYKKVITQFINQIKEEKICTEEDVEDRVEAIKFLEKLMILTTEDIENASIKKFQLETQRIG